MVIGRRNQLIAIDKERFHKLVTSLRTAVGYEYKLDKEQTSYNDLLDAFRFSLIFYKWSKASKQVQTSGPETDAHGNITGERCL